MVRSNIEKKQDSLHNPIARFKNAHINTQQYVNPACYYNLPL
jgi:hypothetical protein